MVAVSVSTAGKPSINLDFPGKHPQNVTIKEVKSAIRAKFPKLVHNRQRITYASASAAAGAKAVALTDEARTLGSYDIPEGAKLKLKDLGHQVAYRWLYLWEYAGVIFINPLMFAFSQTSYAKYIPFWGPYTPSTLQITTRNLIVLHFLKRFLESAFVHSFSRETLPLRYIYRNAAYYWGLVGIVMSLTLYRPAFSAAALQNSILGKSTWITFWSVWILINEALNLNAHLHLASLRVAPGQPRKYPTGLGFGTVVCANYWFETLGVLGMAIMTGGDFGTLIYTVGAMGAMGNWAGQKYRRYKREQDPKVFPGKRWKMFPPLY